MSYNSRGPGSDRIHPFVYRAILGLALLLIASIWGFFGGRTSTGLVLTIASLFVGIALTLSYVLSRIARTFDDRDTARERGASFGAWLKGDFDSYGGRQPAREALVALFLPIIAVSLGMLVFALTLHFSV